ncbi:hypothetical protein C7974DRAFT_379148 [Boeremia exigua]|uniref:uncharacterized protein n=1 Tax=Boeremia exigua TaxID=749465 RepID=UPI001E8D08AF|nr:uncharacterized protein C7974DRAFT_379148 [Boeremia exigua]KAH6619035.1 hypothetical protein C7974DRAFT_379148 [Boeremia exigua]
MTSNLMATEKGGEQTQYEAEASDMVPHKKEAGQLGASAAQGGSTLQPTSASDTKTNAPNTHGITPAEKIRYGQSISEGGMGGQTVGMGGVVDKEEGTGDARKAMGYTEGGEGDGIGG